MTLTESKLLNGHVVLYAHLHVVPRIMCILDIILIPNRCSTCDWCGCQPSEEYVKEGHNSWRNSTGLYYGHKGFDGVLCFFSHETSITTAYCRFSVVSSCLASYAPELYGNAVTCSLLPFFTPCLDTCLVHFQFYWLFLHTLLTEFLELTKFINSGPSLLVLQAPTQGQFSNKTLAVVKYMASAAWLFSGHSSAIILTWIWLSLFWHLPCLIFVVMNSILFMAVVIFCNSSCEILNMPFAITHFD